ncbi:MAG: acylneuraminate cytidylyltransferase family protein [Magnetococcales bacterium]|nr:acylneuraminate cytidylyltransferase family protein [Magnetococcales bacterium]
MINGCSVLAVIPARGGSKGVERKNIRMLAGKPLLAWTIEAARACPEIDRVILSSEDEEIMDVARQLGCEVPYVRPYWLAQDDTRAIDVALHLLETLSERYDYLVWLQPTSPLRSADDISACLQLCVRHGAMSAVTVALVDKSPYWIYFVDSSGGMQPLLPGEMRHDNRQKMPPVHALNGAVYVANTAWLQRTARFVDDHTKAYVMPMERSVDIDTHRDFFLAEWFLANASNPIGIFSKPNIAMPDA